MGMSHYVTIGEILDGPWTDETHKWTMSIAKEAATVFARMEWKWSNEVPDKWDIDARIGYMLNDTVRRMKQEPDALEKSTFAGRLQVMCTRSTNGELRCEVLIHYNLGMA